MSKKKCKHLHTTGSTVGHNLDDEQLTKCTDCNEVLKITPQGYEIVKVKSSK
jgi:hypothetical protein